MKLKYEFIITEIDDQFVAVPVGVDAEEFNGVIHLNETAKIIMEALAEETTAEIIINDIVQKYTESSETEISEYVNGFIANLEKAELIK